VTACRPVWHQGEKRGCVCRRAVNNLLCRLKIWDALNDTKLHIFSWLFPVYRRWPTVSTADLYRAVSRSAPSVPRAPISEEASPENRAWRYWWDIRSFLLYVKQHALRGCLRMPCLVSIRPCHRHLVYL